MSNIRKDNPQLFLAVAEQINGFQNAFGKFIENMRNALKTIVLFKCKLFVQMLKTDCINRLKKK